MIDLDVWLSAHLIGPGAEAAAWLTHLGEPLLALPLLAAGLFWLHGAAEAKRRIRRVALAGLVLLVLVQGGKRLINRPRPGAQIATYANLPGGHLRGHAFPSGHTAFGAFVAGSLMIHPVSLGLRGLLLLYAIVVGWSRVAMGAHWPSDVLAGMTLGFLLAFMGQPRHRERPS